MVRLGLAWRTVFYSDKLTSLTFCYWKRKLLRRCSWHESERDREKYLRAADGWRRLRFLAQPSQLSQRLSSIELQRSIFKGAADNPSCHRCHLRLFRVAKAIQCCRSAKGATRRRDVNTRGESSRPRDSRDSLDDESDPQFGSSKICSRFEHTLLGRDRGVEIADWRTSENSRNKFWELTWP